MKRPALCVTELDGRVRVLEGPDDMDLFLDAKDPAHALHGRFAWTLIDEVAFVTDEQLADEPCEAIDYHDPGPACRE